MVDIDIEDEYNTYLQLKFTLMKSELAYKMQVESCENIIMTKLNNLNKILLESSALKVEVSSLHVIDIIQGKLLTLIKKIEENEKLTNEVNTEIINDFIQNIQSFSNKINIEEGICNNNLIWSNFLSSISFNEITPHFSNLQNFSNLLKKMLDFILLLRNQISVNSDYLNSKEKIILKESISKLKLNLEVENSVLLSKLLN